MGLVTRATFGRPNGQEPPAKQPCRECGSPLARLNPSDICSPCNGGEWEGPELTEAQVKRLRVARLEEIGAVAA